MFQCQTCKRWLPESLYAPANSAGNCQECALGMKPAMTPDEEEVQRLRTRLALAERVVAAAKELMADTGVEMNDPRLLYFVAQVDREAWAALHAALTAWEAGEESDGEK